MWSHGSFLSFLLLPLKGWPPPTLTALYMSGGDTTELERALQLLVRPENLLNDEVLQQTVTAAKALARRHCFPSLWRRFSIQAHLRYRAACRTLEIEIREFRTASPNELGDFYTRAVPPPAH